MPCAIMVYALKQEVVLFNKFRIPVNPQNLFNHIVMFSLFSQYTECCLSSGVYSSMCCVLPTYGVCIC